MRKNITIMGCRSGVSYLQRTLHQYFNKEVTNMFIYPGDLEFDYEKHEIKNLNLLIENKPDFFAMNYLSGPESNCHVIKKVKEISPRTKIIFISTTIQTTSKEVLEAGADVCFDCECIPVIGGGRMTGGAAISAIAWILDNFPQEPIENTWSRKN